MDIMKISIITPTYNSEKLIGSCLDSIRKQQGNFKIQHIIVDGNSEDKTIDIIKDYKESVNYDVKIIVGRDKNMYDAINKGIKYIKGEVWACLNSDDIYLPYTLNNVTELFKKNKDVEIIYGLYDAIDVNDNFLYRRFLPEFNLDKLIRMGCSAIMPQPTTFMRKNVMAKVDYFDIKYDYASDYDYQIRLGKKCKVLRIKDVLTKFRKHSRSISLRENNQVGESIQISKNYATKSYSNLRIKLDWVQFYLLHLRIINFPFIIYSILKKKKLY